MRLIDKLHPLKHELFFDNYFASPELMYYLKKEKEIWAVSTLNKNLSHKCPIPTEKEMKEGGRGTSEEFVDSSRSIVVTAWYDNKQVLTLSNYVGKDPIGKCNCYDKLQKKRIEIDRPNSVVIYNKFMVGVDKADMLLSLYRTKYRLRKWYHRLAFHLLSLAVINSWTIYRQTPGLYIDKLLDYISTNSWTIYRQIPGLYIDKFLVYISTNSWTIYRRTPGLYIDKFLDYISTNSWTIHRQIPGLYIDKLLDYISTNSWTIYRQIPALYIDKFLVYISINSWTIYRQIPGLYIDKLAGMRRW